MSDAAEPSRAPDPPEPENEVKAGFLEHLEELRKRLLRAVLGILAGGVATGIYAQPIYRWLMDPVIATLPEGQRALHFTSSIEPFKVYLKVAMYGGIFVSAPWILYQVWEFIAPGLYRREKKVVVPFLAFGTLLFYAGAAFCYYGVMPVAFPALTALAGPDMSPILTMGEQLSLVLAMVLGFGIVFELPVIIAFLAMLGVVTPQFLAKYRRHAIIVNVLAAAIITPTGDPMSLALMAIPMVVFYEIGILLARLLGRKGEEEKALAKKPSTA